MITNEVIERRCRYRLAQHGLRFHKSRGNTGAVYYIYESGEEDSVPEEDCRFLDLEQLLAFCEELQEKTASA